eukprot:580683_1
MSKKQRDANKYVKKMKKLRKKSSLENHKCADCGTPNPSWVSLTIGVYLCMRCSNIHRNLPHRISIVKSVDLDSFTNQMYKAVKSKGGNKKINKIYESTHMGFNPSTKPNIHSDNYALRQYITLKYCEKKWYSLKALKQPKAKRKRHKKQQPQEDDEDEEEEEDDEEDEQEDDQESDPNSEDEPSPPQNITHDDFDDFDDFDPFSKQLPIVSPVVAAPYVPAPAPPQPKNNALMDLTQMEKANQWHQYEDNDDEKHSGTHIIDTLLNGGNNDKTNGQKTTNKILQKYQMQQNAMNNMNQMHAMNNHMNMMNQMQMNNMPPAQMRQHLQRMEMQLKQMQMNLMPQPQTQPNVSHTNNTNNNVDDWADFGDMNAHSNATNVDDDWGDFHDGNGVHSNTN